MNLESKIEAVLFFKNEPVSVMELAEWLGEKPEAIRKALVNLADSCRNRGVVLVSNGEWMSLGTHPGASQLVEDLQKEELSRELGRAGLEALAIILYKGPISRREIDYIRGVNSSFILRTLLVRGLVERTESTNRSYRYEATIKLLEYLGITGFQDLPEYENVLKKITDFTETTAREQDGSR